MICIQQTSLPPGHGGGNLNSINNFDFTYSSLSIMSSSKEGTSGRAASSSRLPSSAWSSSAPVATHSTSNETSSASTGNSATAATPAAARSRAERSLLSVLEKERQGRATGPLQQPSPPLSAPSPPPRAMSPIPRPSSRSSTRSPVPSVSPSRAGSRNRDREVDLDFLVSRSIALQTSSPPTSPPGSPPRAIPRRPHFSTSPSTTIPEVTESESDHNSSSSFHDHHRRRAATLSTPTVLPSLTPPLQRPTALRTRSSPLTMSVTPADLDPSPVPLAPAPRRAIASVAAASLLGHNYTSTGLTHLPPSARTEAQAYTPANTLASRDRPLRPSTLGAIPTIQRQLGPYSYPGAGNVPQQNEHLLRPAISNSSFASSGTVNSVPSTPPTPSASPLNPCPAHRREYIKRSPRPISGPFLVPTPDVPIAFDGDRANRRLRNAPGRVNFDDVALFPPEDEADDEDESDDPARKKPRMERRWSLW